MSERTKEQVIAELVEAAKEWERAYWTGVSDQTLRGSKKPRSVRVALLVRELQELERKPRFVVTVISRDERGPRAADVFDVRDRTYVSTHRCPDAQEAAEASAEWYAQKYGRWVE